MKLINPSTYALAILSGLLGATTAPAQVPLTIRDLNITAARPVDLYNNNPNFMRLSCTIGSVPNELNTSNNRLDWSKN
jgi:hypothetical protein